MHFEGSSYNLGKSLMCAQRSQKLQCGEVGKIERNDIPTMMVRLGYWRIPKFVARPKLGLTQ